MIAASEEGLYYAILQRVVGDRRNTTARTEQCQALIECRPEHLQLPVDLDADCLENTCQRLDSMGTTNHLLNGTSQIGCGLQRTPFDNRRGDKIGRASCRERD